MSKEAFLLKESAIAFFCLAKPPFLSIAGEDLGSEDLLGIVARVRRERA